ncbi:MAG: dephospho-CoA kinase [Acidimicrobiia bacterium]
MHKVAVIGQIGAGKSEVVRICSEMDFPIVSADHIARMLLDLPGVAHDDVAKAFPDVVDSVGRINRHALAMDVFSNEEHLELLESIIHPHVWQIVASFFMECEKKGEDICFVEVSAPDESIKTRFDEMWFIDADINVRKQRCIDRGMDEKDFEARNKFQESHLRLCDLASRTILNEGTIEELENSIKSICAELSR